MDSKDKAKKGKAVIPRQKWMEKAARASGKIHEIQAKPKPQPNFKMPAVSRKKKPGTI
jgi:hypothetical protein